MTLPSFTTLLSQSLGTYKKYWQSFGMIALLFSAIPGLLFTLAFTPPGETVPLADFSPLIWLLTVALTVLGMIGSLASIHLVHHRETNADWYAAAKVGINRFLPYLSVVIPTAIIILLGLILVIVPGIIISVYLMFVSYVFVIEQQRGLAALRRSRDLVRGHFWLVLGRTFLLGLLYVIIAVPLSLIQVVGPVVVSLALSPIATIYFYYLYKSLSESSEKPA